MASDEEFFDRLDAALSNRTPGVAGDGQATKAVERGTALPTLDQVLGSAAPAGAAAITDDFIEKVSARVIERIGLKAGATLPEAVARIVSEIAERLVREEIAKIRSGQPASGTRQKSSER